MSRVLICNMSSVYENEDFYTDRDYRMADFSNLSGTNSYLDDEARSVLRSFFIEDHSFIHFLDNGNYHYLSYLFFEKVDRDFNLILLDNHPDCKAPAFGEVLSCGGWIRSALRDYPHLKKVFMLGVNEELLEELKDLGDDMDRVVVIPFDNFLNESDGGDLSKLMSPDLPLYISLDKDVLSRDFVVTNWDQGEMTEKNLYNILKDLKKSFNIVGLDICGECEPHNDKDCGINDKINKNLLEIFY